LVCVLVALGVSLEVPLASLLQALVQCPPFLQHALFCAIAPPDNKATATNNNVSFFIFFDLEIKDKE